MNYSEYLFSRLLIEMIPEPYAIWEYDLLYDAIPGMYKRFAESDFNHPLLSEYDCMVEYLRAFKYSSIGGEIITAHILGDEK